MCPKSANRRSRPGRTQIRENDFSRMLLVVSIASRKAQIARDGLLRAPAARDAGRRGGLAEVPEPWRLEPARRERYVLVGSIASR